MHQTESATRTKAGVVYLEIDAKSLTGVHMLAYGTPYDPSRLRMRLEPDFGGNVWVSNAYNIEGSHQYATKQDFACRVFGSEVDGKTMYDVHGPGTCGAWPRPTSPTRSVLRTVT